PPLPMHLALMLSLFMPRRGPRTVGYAHHPLDSRSLRFGNINIALPLVFAILAGCTQQDQITSYRVRKPEQVDPTLVSTANATKQPATDQQTLGLIVPVGDSSWFFKLTGDAKAVEPQQEAFLRFAQTIKFSGDTDAKPSWTLPSDWKELPGSGFRFATIQIPSEGKPLELAVSSAGGNILDNVNRWRK